MRITKQYIVSTFFNKYLIYIFMETIVQDDSYFQQMISFLFCINLKFFYFKQ